MRASLQIPSHSLSGPIEPLDDILFTQGCLYERVFLKSTFSMRLIWNTLGFFQSQCVALWSSHGRVVAHDLFLQQHISMPATWSVQSHFSILHSFYHLTCMSSCCARLLFFFSAIGTSEAEGFSQLLSHVQDTNKDVDVPRKLSHWFRQTQLLLQDTPPIPGIMHLSCTFPYDTQALSPINMLWWNMWNIKGKCSSDLLKTVPTVFTLTKIVNNANLYVPLQSVVTCRLTITPHFLFEWFYYHLPFQKTSFIHKELRVQVSQLVFYYLLPVHFLCSWFSLANPNKYTGLLSHMWAVKRYTDGENAVP